MLLYIHIPFCDSLCHYCAFNSYTHLHAYKESYMQAIMIDLEASIKRFDVKKKSIETLFIGGGTPSCVDAPLYKPLFDFIRPYLYLDAEITTEANPNSASESWLLGMKELGVNRVSFGVQSFDAKKLHFLNRAHTPEQAIEAIQYAKKIGFKDISLDLIYGNQIDTKALLENDLKIAFSLPINHLSAYSLTIEENTPFFKTPQVAVDDESLAFWFVDAIKERFTQYEISNFSARPSKHNLGYWQYKSYLGVGAGAVGFHKDRRFYTQKDVLKYIENPTKVEIEDLSEDDIKEEKILLGLRSRVGVQEKILDHAQLQKAKELVEAGKLHYHDSHFSNPNFFLADALALYLTS